MIHPNMLLTKSSARIGNIKISAVPYKITVTDSSVLTSTLRTLALLVTLALGARAQTPATLETQIAALTARVMALQATVTVLTAEVAVQKTENANLQNQISNEQKQVTIVQSNETMQAANLAALNKSFAPVQSAVTATQSTDTAQSAAITAIQRQLNLVASNPALALGPFVKVDLNPENSVVGPNIVFTGANIHIESGYGATADNETGLGNLIIGYDEGYAIYSPSEPPIRGGSHNLIVGPNHAWGYGYNNVIFGEGSTIQIGNSNCVLGGSDQFIQTASGSIILGGTGNVVFMGGNDVVGGGTDNVVTGQSSVLLGGAENSTPFFSTYISEFGPKVPAPTPAPAPAAQSMRTLN
jgi:hypothetical protein